MEADVLTVIATAVSTGMVASGATVAALKVHIQYIRDHNDAQDERLDAMTKRIDHVERTAERAHHRIDLVEKGHS